MKRELFNDITPLPAIPPGEAVADNTPWTSAIINTAGYDSLTFLLSTGVQVDPDATFAVKLLAGDASDLSDGAEVPASDLVGSLSLAGFDFSADGKTRKIGYVGGHRYVRLTVTPSGNTGDAFLSAIALLGHPHVVPTANPPA